MKFNINQMMQQAQKMQEEMERVKREIALKQVDAESGGGMVKVVMNGEQKVVSIKIAKEIVDPNDIEMLEDLVVAAVNKAWDKSTEMAKDEMNKLGGMLPNIPGFNL
jgi:DNA-binding YbaB/EbfC family protein